MKQSSRRFAVTSSPDRSRSSPAVRPASARRSAGCSAGTAPGSPSPAASRRRSKQRRKSSVRGARSPYRHLRCTGCRPRCARGRRNHRALRPPRHRGEQRGRQLSRHPSRRSRPTASRPSWTSTCSEPSTFPRLLSTRGSASTAATSSTSRRRSSSRARRCSHTWPRPKRASTRSPAPPRWSGARTGSGSTRIAPGTIAGTEGVRRFTETVHGRGARRGNPLGLIGHGTDIAYQVLYFCSDAARFISGSGHRRRRRRHRRSAQARPR